jgi:aminoglycoside phosphotransferase (APT) family kinase protein
VHGDYHLGNLLVHRARPEIAAIVDWELTTIGDPLIDIAWLIATLPDALGRETASGIAVPGGSALPTAGDVLTRYAAGTLRDVSKLQWHCVLACYKFGVIVEGTYARACAGVAPMEVGLPQHRRAVAMVKRAHEFIARGIQ